MRRKVRVSEHCNRVIGLLVEMLLGQSVLDAYVDSRLERRTLRTREELTNLPNLSED